MDEVSLQRTITEVALCEKRSEWAEALRSLIRNGQRAIIIAPNEVPVFVEALGLAMDCYVERAEALRIEIQKALNGVSLSQVEAMALHEQARQSNRAAVALREALLAVCKACPPPDVPHATKTPAREAHILAIKVLVEAASLFGEKIR